jgi:hypothetical protein
VCDYGDAIWQRRNLLLVALPSEGDVVDSTYVDDLLQQSALLTHHDTRLVLTRESVPGLPKPGLLVADRWGEIYFAVSTAHVSELPRPSTILTWVRAVDHECPECQGEAH